VYSFSIKLLNRKFSDRRIVESLSNTCNDICLHFLVGGFICPVFMFYLERAMKTENKFCFTCLSSTESFVQQLRMRGAGVR